MRPLRYDDQTVLITGASSGLGAEFARRLAARGADLVLVARRADRLQELATELHGAHGSTVTTLARDLSEPGAGEALREELTGHGVRVTALINNAGFANSGAFHEIDAADLRREVALDVATLTDVARAFIGDLRSARGGFLINLASVASYQPIPMMATYAASKAFVLSLTESLWAESRGTGLRVLALAPGPTETEFFDIAGEGASAGLPKMSAPEVVDLTLSALERRTPPLTVVPGRRNRALSIAGRLFPRRPLVTILSYGMRRARR